ncbi:MAG: saccharopine dehydrogenase NADP-binding domain-containing protein, partial [Bacteroidota bacterium]|nr:saccharopine dehydrogenase NADP-binding domain-containing protein [Bacteroidota bacterium]
MKQIFIAGAGLSSASLIEYLLKQSTIYDWKVIVGDYDIFLARQRINGHQNGQAISFDVFDQEQRNDAIRQADIVISMLPASMHIILAEDCVIQGVDMVTASYVSDDIAALNERAIEKGVILLNETG